MVLRAPLACLLAGLTALLTGVTVYQATHGRHAKDDDAPALPEFVARDFYGEDVRKQEDLKKFDGVLHARAEERRLLCDKLAHGRLSLFETAAEFKRLNALPQPAQFDVLQHFTGASPNERVCRQVITWLSNNLHELPESQQQLVLERLEADLRDHIACNGTVILPGG